MSKQIKQYLEYILILLLFAVPLSQLYVADLHFPYVTGRNLLFRLIVEMSAIIFCISRPVGNPFIGTLSIAGITLLLSVMASNLLGVDPYKSMWSSMERMQGFVSLIHYIAYFLILSRVVCRHKKRWISYLGMMSLISFIVAVCGIYGGDHNGYRYGTYLFVNKSYLAAYLLFGIFFTVLLSRQLKHGYLLIAVLLVQVYALYLTQNRGALLALAMSSCVGITFYWFRRRVAVSIILIAAFFGIYKAIDAPGFINNERFHAWKIALAGAVDRPLMGWGQENFDVVYDKYHKKIYETDDWWDNTHNIIVTVLIETGLVGLTFFLVFCFIVYRKIYRCDQFNNWDKAIWRMIAMAFFIKAMFFFETITTSIGLATLMAYLWSLNNVEPLGPQAPAKAMIIIMSCFFMYYTVNEGRAYSKFIYLMSGHRTMRYKIDGFKEYFLNPPKNVDYTRQFFLGFVHGASTVENISMNYKEELYSMALKEIESAIIAHPGQKKLRQARADFLRLVDLD